MTQQQFVQLGAATPFELAPGVLGRGLFGDQAMLNLIDLEPGAVVPVHSHPHEQLGIVFSGTLILEVEGVDHPLGPLDAYSLAGGVQHGARAGEEGCRILDVFHPVREDYRAKAAATGGR